MSDAKALLAAIWEHPHEDTPRLMYADWLQEHGDAARAEFIRVQCELAHLDEWEEEKRPTLERREAKLWKKHAKAWREELPSDLRKSPFRRGFVSPDQRPTNANRFCALPASAFVAAPAWDYAINSAPDGLSALAKSANLPRVEKLKLWMNSNKDDVQEMLSSPQVRNVRVLGLGQGTEWGRNISTLATNPATKNLTNLFLHEGLDDAVAAVVASSPGFAKLRAFGAHHHEVTPDGLRSIFNSPHLAGLTELTLPSWYKEEGARAISETRPAFRLRKLDIFGAWMSDEGVALIANWPGLESVHSLHIGGRCEVVGPRALSSSPYATNLRELDLGLSRLSRAGAMTLAKSKTLNLKRLLIRMTPAAEDETAVAALVKRFGEGAVKVRYPGQRKRG